MRAGCARKVFAGLQSGAPDTSRWTADLKSYMRGHRLQQYARSLSRLGTVESFWAHPATATDGLESRDYDVVARGQRLKLHLLLQSDGLLEDVNVSDAEQR